MSAIAEEARDWLEANVPDEALPSMDTAEGFEAHRDWERKLHDGRWSAVYWPPEYGGRGATLRDWLAFEHAYAHAGAPGRVNQNGIYLLGPTLLEHASDAMKARWLPAMARGDEIWCQGWSEPDAGSDLASLTSKAVADGDDWVITGQKTWCSRGAFADMLFGLFRSEPASERHRGLSYLIVPMRSAGVTVRPIRQLDSDTGFAEVFFDGVRVPQHLHTIGEAGNGWSIAMATAGFERGLLLRPPGRFQAAAQRLVELCAETGTHREAVVEAWMRAEAYRLFTETMIGRLEAGEAIGAEASMNKLFWSQMDIDLHATAMSMLGDDAQLRNRWTDAFLFAQAGPIYAGTNEIQRSIVAERMLGLPR